MKQDGQLINQQFDIMENTIYSEQIKIGKRTYFLDINLTKDGKKCLEITESKKTDNGFERFKVLVFEEGIEKFSEAFVRVLLRMNSDKIQENKITYSVDKIRENHEKAYKPWNNEEENTLEQLFCEGKSIPEISEILGRKKGAIQSRIKKMELKEKYE